MARKRTKTFFNKRVIKAIVQAVIVTVVIAGFAWLAPIMFSGSRGGPFW